MSTIAPQPSTQPRSRRPSGHRRASPRASALAVRAAAGQRALHGLGHPRVERHALGRGGLLGLALDLLDQPQRDPADVAAVARRTRGTPPGAGRLRFGLGLRLDGRLPADRDPDVAPVEAHLHHPVAERRGDLRGEVGQRVHEGQPGGGLDGRAEQRGGPPGLLVAGGGGRGEVLAQLVDVLTEIHDATVASERGVSQGHWRRHGRQVAPSWAGGPRLRFPACRRSCRCASSSWPRPSSSRRPTCRGAPTPTAARRWPSSPAGPATSPGPSRTRPPPPTPATCGTSSRSGTCRCSSTARVSFYLTGVSRSLTHELIRHRHFSYSQLSQRYVPERDAAMVEPEVIADRPGAARAVHRGRGRVGEGLRGAAGRAGAAGSPTSPNATLRRKQARQAARAILPNATETRIVVTGNYRAWRHFIAMRATEHADVEIRELAVECLRQLQREVAQRVRRLRDRRPGRRHARSPPARSSPRADGARAQPVATGICSSVTQFCCGSGCETR